MHDQRPTIGRIVHFRSRTGGYTVPAIVTATTETLAPAGVEVWERSVEARRDALLEFEPNADAVPELPPLAGVPPLSSDVHVHLAVFTPGIPGMRGDAQDFVTEGLLRQENVNGVYQEWDVPLAGSEPAAAWLGDEQPPGTWAWPPRV